MSDQVYVAVLDENRAYFGKRAVDVPTVGDVVVPEYIDLPPDGTYKHDEASGAFVPLGHGFGKLSTRPPCTDGYVLYQVAKALAPDLGGTVREWVAWYEKNLRQRDEERQLALMRRGARRR